MSAWCDGCGNVGPVAFDRMTGYQLCAKCRKGEKRYFREKLKLGKEERKERKERELIDPDLLRRMRKYEEIFIRTRNRVKEYDDRKR